MGDQGEKRNRKEKKFEKKKEKKKHLVSMNIQTVVMRINGNGFNSQLFACTDNTNGNLSSEKKRKEKKRKEKKRKEKKRKEKKRKEKGKGSYYCFLDREKEKYFLPVSNQNSLNLPIISHQLLREPEKKKLEMICLELIGCWTYRSFHCR